MPIRRPRIRRSASPSSASTSVSPSRMPLPGSIRPGGGHQPQQRQAGEALAAARFADQRQRLAPVEREADAVHRIEPAAAGARERDPQVARPRALGSCASGIDGVAQGVAEQVGGEHGDHDGEAGKDAGPGRGHQHRLGVEDHAAPGGSRRLDAEAEEGEPGLEQDHVTHAERRRDQQRTERVGQQVPEDNPPPPARRAPPRPGRSSPPGAAAPRRAPAGWCRTIRWRRSAGPAPATGTRSQTASTSSRMKSRGIASAPSTSRISTASTAPPRYPATMPTAAPSVTESATARSATPSEIRAPGDHPGEHVPAQLVGAERVAQAGRQVAGAEHIGLRQRIGQQPGPDEARAARAARTAERPRGPAGRARRRAARPERGRHASRTRGSSSGVGHVGQRSSPVTTSSRDQQRRHPSAAG